MNRLRYLVYAVLFLGSVQMGGCVESRWPEVSPEFKKQWMDEGSLQSVHTCVRGLQIHARVSIDPAPPGAPPLVLVHGSGLSGRYMIPTATELTSRFRIYLPDMPGFGRSGDPGEILDVPELADWLVDWMPTVGLERASFLGNSFGCQVIADLAARYPGRVDKAVLQGPTTPTGERSMFWQFIRWRQNQRYNPEWMGEITSRAYEQAGWWRLVRYFFIQISDPIEGKMPRIEAPVLVVCGEEDPIANPQWCRRLADLAPRGQVEFIPGVAHTLVFTTPEKLSRVTEDFILAEEAPETGTGLGNGPASSEERSP